MEQQHPAASHLTSNGDSNALHLSSSQHGNVSDGPSIPQSINGKPDESDRMHEFEPPFLVRTKSRQEKNAMQEQYDRQKKERSPYRHLCRLYERFTPSALLENKAAVARDHLANERTFLAWLRTSLSLVTVGVAITQLYNLTPSSHASSGRAIGATFVCLSIVFLYFANARYFHSQVALTKDQFPASRGAVAFGSLSVLAVLLAMFIIIILDQKK